VEPDAPSAEPSIAAAVDLSPEAFAEVWPAVIESLQEQSPHLAAVVQAAHPGRLSDGELTLAWPESDFFYKRKAEDPASKETIVRAIRAVTGSSLRLAYELRDASEIAVESAPRLSEEELVDRFVEEFDAEVLPPTDQQEPT
jgi:DNA polymerase-3 subunit gamma/tau